MAREIEYSPITGRPIKIMDKPTRVAGLPDWDLLYVEFDSPKERDRIRGIIVRGAEEGMAAIKKITDKRIYFEPWIGVPETTGETSEGEHTEDMLRRAGYGA